jgi:uncharacterized lipoprotein YajG
MATKTIKSTERSNGVVTNDEIKTKLYSVMADVYKSYPPVQRAVAEDFSDEELDEFINTYYSYLIK